MNPAKTSGGFENIGFNSDISVSCNIGHFEYPPTYNEGSANTTLFILNSLIIKEHTGQGSQLVYNVQADKSDVPNSLWALFNATISACSDILVL
jgi:hypothetical protein